MSVTIHVGNRRDPNIPNWPTYYVGRPSPLGNPFVIGRDGTRTEVIERYRAWLDEQMATDPPSPASRQLARLLRAARQHRVMRLTCWCDPLPCHARVIANIITDLLDPDAQRREDEALFWKEAFG